MRSSILSRSVVAVATMAIGSVALAATPATAASAQGVTRDEVLTAVNGVRAARAAVNIADNSSEFSLATNRALRSIAVKGCGVSTNPADDESVDIRGVDVTNAGGTADGILISAEVNISNAGTNKCTIAAFAAADGSFQLAGTAQISATTSGTDANVVLRTQALSGDAFVTSPLDESALDNVNLSTVTASAAGNATKTTTVTTFTKVKDKKTKSEKKKAKAKYTKKVKSVKKSYAKALDKAGKSKSKKAAAKKVYKAKRASAKAKYKYAIASYKLVKKSTSSIENRAFSVKTPNPRFGTSG